jgi:hypothetical protein
MRKPLTLLLLILFSSCSPFDEHRVLKHEDQLTDLAVKLTHYPAGFYTEDDINEFEIDLFRDLDIDAVYTNGKDKNTYFSGFFEENDILIIFIRYSGIFHSSEKRIIYDYKKLPRKHDSETLPLASYTIKPLNNRWYYSEKGFN